MYYLAAIVLGSAIMQFVLLPFYIRLKHKMKFAPLKITIKGCMTLIAVIVCAYGIFTLYERTGDIHNLTTASGFKTDLIVLIGLTICMIADVMLVIYFPVGMLFFLIGHICYIIYFLKLAPFNLLSIVLFLIPAIISGIYFSRYKEKMGKLLPACYIYGCVILCTFSIGIMLPFSIGPYGVIPAISAVMLVISDYMLAANKFVAKNSFSDLMYLGYYFSGQYFLSLSVFVPIVFNL